MVLTLSSLQHAIAESESDPLRDLTCVMGYELGHRKTNLWRVDDTTYVVTYMDYEHLENCKALVCLGYAHARDIHDGCIERIREWMN